MSYNYQINNKNKNRNRDRQKEIKITHTENSFRQRLNITNRPSNKWVYQESLRTEGQPCDKMCNGIQRISLNPVCMNNQKKVDETLCPNEKARPKYIEKACNTDCRLQ